jgi:hypothetical protein
MNDQVSPMSKTQLKKLAAKKHNELVALLVSDTRSPTTEERTELEALSKEVFGSASHYATILKKGTIQARTEEVTELVPAVQDAEGKELTPEETRQVQVNVKYRSKRGLTDINQLQIIRHSVDSVKALMLDHKAKMDAFKAMMAKMEAEKNEANEKAKLNEAVQKAAGGSAI